MISAVVINIYFSTITQAKPSAFPKRNLHRAYEEPDASARELFIWPHLLAVIGIQVYINSPNYEEQGESLAS